MTKILERSSIGDKRFSAFYANVEYGGRETNIERHYQSAKFFKNKPKKVKGVQPGRESVFKEVEPLIKILKERMK